MNKAMLQTLLQRSLAKEITFPQSLSILVKEDIESYHIDFFRNECRYYAKNGESLIVNVPFNHREIAQRFVQTAIDAINTRVQAGQATFADFVQESTASGCAYYIVYVNGQKVRYFGRHGDEHIQSFPGTIMANVQDSQ
jgi:uncharacterized protein YbcV (DUF1398 family)